MAKIGIYLLEFANGSRYIGQSNNIDRRISEHFNEMQHHKNKGIRHHFLKYGHPSVVVLEECSLFDLNSREIHWISVYDTYQNGLNLTEGGGFKRAGAPSPETTNIPSPAVCTATVGKDEPASNLPVIITILVGCGLLWLIYVFPPSLLIMIIGFLCLR